MDREVTATLRPRALHPPRVTIKLTLRVLCPREDPSTLPDDREDRRSGFFRDSFTQTRFFMLQRGNLRRSLDDLRSLKQRLLREASRVIGDRSASPDVTLHGQSIDPIFMHSALHLQDVLRKEQYSHLQKIPVEMACKVVMFWRGRLELLREVALQESMEDPGDSRAFPATREAIDWREKTNVDDGSQEGGSGDGEPCAICLEDMKLRAQEVARMACKHKFHRHCLARWLKMSNSCPLCRFAMPTSSSDVD